MIKPSILFVLILSLMIGVYLFFDKLQSIPERVLQENQNEVRQKFLASTFNDSLPTLENLMYKYGSDKSRDDHGYTKFYSMIFDPIRSETKMFLELGIAAGQSLQAWNDFFPNAEIHGIDLHLYDPVIKNLDKLERVTTHIVDIREHGFSLEENGLIQETFDIIIDDGPHYPDDQESFLNILFPLLKPGGIYIIEDLCGHTGGKARFHEKPELLRESTREIIEENNSILIDTAVGHRAWDLWKSLVNRYAKDHLSHNSYLFVIQKRLPKDYHEIQINFGSVAMLIDKIIESRRGRRLEFKN